MRFPCILTPITPITPVSVGNGVSLFNFLGCLSKPLTDCAALSSLDVTSCYRNFPMVAHTKYLDFVSDTLKTYRRVTSHCPLTTSRIDLRLFEQSLGWLQLPLQRFFRILQLPVRKFKLLLLSSIMRYNSSSHYS